jgi:large subunit ribosomal protein L5
MGKNRLKDLYETSIRPQLLKELGLNNVMQVPKLTKIVLNVGAKAALTNSKILQAISEVMAQTTGQMPVRTVAKKSIAGFKLREGMPIGVKVTLRGKKMFEFFDKFVNLALPRVRDFRGVSDKFDGQGNYNIGLQEWIIFPEVDYEKGSNLGGFNITIHTTAEVDAHGIALLSKFGMPFIKNKQ